MYILILSLIENEINYLSCLLQQINTFVTLNSVRVIDQMWNAVFLADFRDFHEVVRGPGGEAGRGGNDAGDLVRGQLGDFGLDARDIRS